MLLFSRKIDVERVVAAIEPTKLVQGALSDLAAKALAERQSLVATLGEIEKAAEKKFPILTAALDSAVKAQLTAEAALLSAKRAVDRARNSRLSASMEFSHEHDAIENALIASASPAIATFVREMWAELHNPPQPSFERFQEKNAITGRVTSHGGFNTSLIHARLAALRDAVHQAEAMRFEPDQSTVPERLDALRAAFPTI